MQLNSLELPEENFDDFGSIKTLLKRPELTQNIEWCLRNDLQSFPRFAENICMNQSS